MDLSILGAGGWGTALAFLLNENGNRVTLWSYDKDTADNIKIFRENKNFLPGITIPFEINITNSLIEAVNASKIIVLSIPVQYLRSVLVKLQKIDISEKMIINTAKGLEIESLLFPSQLLHKIFSKIKKNNIVTLSGPSHAEEVARKKPTKVISASTSIKNAKLAKKLFENNFFIVESSTDILGVEIGAALKNIIAIAAGLSDGLAMGDNTKVGILIKGLTEISELGVKMGAQKDTFFGLSGLGDLMVTCYSRHSRNHYVGEELGKGRALKEIISNMKMTAEGIATTKSAKKLLSKYGAHSRVISEVYNVLYEHKSPHKAVIDIMAD